MAHSHAPSFEANDGHSGGAQPKQEGEADFAQECNSQSQPVTAVGGLSGIGASQCGRGGLQSGLPAHQLIAESFWRNRGPCILTALGQDFIRMLVDNM